MYKKWNTRMALMLLDYGFCRVLTKFLLAQTNQNSNLLANVISLLLQDPKCTLVNRTVEV